MTQPTPSEGLTRDEMDAIWADAARVVAAERKTILRRRRRSRKISG